MRNSDTPFKSKIESASEIERVLIEIGDFNSVKVESVFSGGSLDYHAARLIKEGRPGNNYDATISVNKLELNKWARRCEKEGRFKSAAYLIIEKLEELFGDD